MDFLIVDQFLREEQCNSLIAISEAIGYKEADISFPEGGKMIKEYRNNFRVLYSDENFREELEKTIIRYAPKKLSIIQEGGTVKEVEFLKLSGNFRFNKYLPGQKFKKHRDGNKEEEGGVSRITVLIYLNSVGDKSGGGTNICDFSLGGNRIVQPSAGRLLLFDHSLMHIGEELLDGVKYVLRSDLIYNG